MVSRERRPLLGRFRELNTHGSYRPGKGNELMVTPEGKEGVGPKKGKNPLKVWEEAKKYDSRGENTGACRKTKGKNRTTAPPKKTIFERTTTEGKDLHLGAGCGTNCASSAEP